MMHARIVSFCIVLAGAAAAGCAAEGEDPNPTGPTAPAGPPIVRPQVVETISLGLAEHDLPAELATQLAISVAHQSSVTLVGGSGGLYELGSEGFRQIDTSPVRAIAAVKDEGLVVANDAGLFVFAGELGASPLSGALGSPVTSLATRGAELWIGTEAGLFIYQDKQLSSFELPLSVASIATFDGARDVIVRLSDGAHRLLREESEGWSVRDFTGEMPEAGALSAVIAGAAGRVFGVAGGQLLERLAGDEDRVLWRPVALAEGEDAAGASGVEAVGIDPATGAVWVIDASALFRIEVAGARISRVPRPSGMSRGLRVAVTHDGAIWLADTAKLRRVGNEGEPPSWMEAIDPISDGTCNQCHKPLGTAPMTLENYDSWVRYIDKIVQRLEAGTMPPSGTPLIGGTVDVVRRWRDGGLRQ